MKRLFGYLIIIDGHVKPKAEFNRAEKRKEAKLQHTEGLGLGLGLTLKTMEKLEENS